MKLSFRQRLQYTWDLWTCGRRQKPRLPWWLESHAKELEAASAMLDRQRDLKRLEQLGNDLAAMLTVGYGTEFVNLLRRMK